VFWPLLWPIKELLKKNFKKDYSITTNSVELTVLLETLLKMDTHFVNPELM
jgi:hypothetical protein